MCHIKDVFSPGSFIKVIVIFGLVVGEFSLPQSILFFFENLNVMDEKLYSVQESGIKCLFQCSEVYGMNTCILLLF